MIAIRSRERKRNIGRELGPPCFPLQERRRSTPTAYDFHFLSFSSHSLTRNFVIFRINGNGNG